MQSNNSKRIVVAIIVVVIAGAIIYAFTSSRKPTQVPVPVVETVSGPKHIVIGKSVQGRNIDAYIYGNGEKHLLLVGGIHGGYEWNSVLLAYTLMDYIDETAGFIPAGVTVTVIPSFNPDGVYVVTGKNGRFASTDVSTSTKVLASGRFNANAVDLNRNFACKWQPKSTWQTKVVSAGKAVFSEPEAQALRDYVADFKPQAVIFWHSKSNAVYASACEDGILPETLKLMDAYSKASGYASVKTFDAYAITGAADDWLASVGIPAFSVELRTHENIEWAKNLEGVKAMIGEVALMSI